IAFIGARWETQVKQGHRREIGLKGLERSSSVFAEMNFVLLAQRPFHLSADRLVIVYNEQPRLHTVWLLRGNMTRKVVPTAGSLSTKIFRRCASTIILD